MGEVIRMLETVPVCVSGHEQMAEWLANWAETLGSGAYGQISSVAIVVETKEGQVGVVSQSMGLMDKARLVGLLTLAAHRKADGQANIMDLVESQ